MNEVGHPQASASQQRWQLPKASTRHLASKGSTSSLAHQGILQKGAAAISEV